MKKKNNLVRSIVWYTNGQLFHPFYLFIAILVAILLLPFKGDPMFGQYLSLYVDLIFIPLLALMSALHIVRNPQITVFELNLFKSYSTVYFARLSVFALGVLIALLPTALVLSYFGLLGSYTLPIIQKILTYTAFTSIALLLDSTKNSLLFLLIFFYLFPYSVPVLINRLEYQGGSLSGNLVTFLYFIDPFYCTVKKAVIKYTNLIPIASILLSILIIFLSYSIFAKKEFEI